MGCQEVTQYEKILLSAERQIAMVERQINEIEEAIITAKAEKGERYTIKELEKTRKSLQARLDKLNDTSRKDDVVTFEQLGVDRLFVDDGRDIIGTNQRKPSKIKGLQMI